ncbi:MAG TPA: hypothetical protein VFR85_14125 [Anaeromyxobacteraceae bacterium]|nr:hypothetical protein [Anaeromyxobacteraceae bacterium]
MDLTEAAASALAEVRARGGTLRFEVRKACEQERWRLKACWLPAGAPAGSLETQLGLLWSDDLEGLEALRRRLESGQDGRRPP